MQNTVIMYCLVQQMLRENQKTVLVLEDDVTISPAFTKVLYHVLREARMFTPSWDFM